MGRSRLIKNLLSVGGVLLFVKLLGFVKQMVIASSFGATIETDLIGLSYGFIGNAQYLLVQVLLTCVVSVYISVRESSPSEARKFAWDTFRAATVIGAVASLLIAVFAPQVSRILAPSYTEALSRQLAAYLRLFAPLLLFFVWSGVFHALLNANGRFIPGQLEGLYQSGILIFLCLAGTSWLGIRALSAGYWLYGVFTAAVLFVQARRYLLPCGGNPFRNPHVHTLLRMVCPLLISYGAVYINQMVDKILVSGLEAGTITAMSYASVLNNLIGTLVCSLCAVLYARMTEFIARGEDAAVAGLAEQSALLLTTLLLPVTVITVCQAEDIVALVYGRGAFGEEEVVLSALALSGYGFSFIPLAWREVYSRVQYGYQDSKRPTRNSVLGIGVNITLSIALCPYWGVLGVALASSISLMVIGGLNMVTARRDAPLLSFSKMRKAIPFWLAGGVVCAVVCKACSMLLSGCPVWLRLIAITAAVAALYGVILLPLLWKLGYLQKLYRRGTAGKD